jgi:hypothetical protein
MGYGLGIVLGQEACDDSGEFGGMEETLKVLHLRTSASTCHNPSFTTNNAGEAKRVPVGSAIKQQPSPTAAALAKRQ